MTIALVGYGAITGSEVNGATLTYQWPSGYSPVIGDMVLLVQGGWMSDPTTQGEVDTQAANITPSGYTYYHGYWRDVTTNANLVLNIHYKFLTGGESAPQVSVPVAYTDSGGIGGVLCGYVIVYRGVHNVNKFDSGAYNQANSAVATSFQVNGTTTQNNVMIVNPVIQGDDNTLTAGSAFSYTFRAIGASYKVTTSLGDAAMAFADQSKGTAGVVTPCVYNSPASDNWVGFFIALMQASITSAPGTPSVTPNAVGGFGLSWSAPSSDGGAAVIKYIIEHSSDNASWGYAAETTGTSINASGYGNNTLIYFRVVTQNGAGYSYSSSASGTTWSIPGTPSAPGVTPNVVGGFSVSWSAPSNGGTAITGYTVQVSSDGVSGWATAATSGSSPVSVSGYGNNTTRYFRVFATNAVGNGNPSTTTSGITWNIPSQVTTLAAVNNNNNSFGLTWTPPSNGGTAITDYVVEWSLKNAGSWNVVSHAALGAASSYTVTGLNVATSYDFRIKATNAVGTAASYSNTATAEGIAKGFWGLALNS